MNVYRNLHHYILSDLKKHFCKMLEYDYFKAKKIKVTYNVYFKDKRKRDLMNFISVADKFFLDDLVNKGCILDDNYNIVEYGIPYFAGYSENNYILAKIEIII